MRNADVTMKNFIIVCLISGTQSCFYLGSVFLPDRVLKINRTFRDSNGKEYTRVEFVRKSSVIDIYLKIRGTKDQEFISKFSALESAEKQKILKEKREIERQLLRLKQQENKLSMYNGLMLHFQLYNDGIILFALELRQIIKFWNFAFPPPFFGFRFQTGYNHNFLRDCF